MIHLEATLTWVGAMFTVLMLLSTFGRFYIRKTKRARIGNDDIIIAFANVFVVATTVVLNVASRHEQPISNTLNVTLTLVAFLLICLVLGSVKVSVLIFYKRVFENRRFHLISNVLIAISAIWTVLFFCLFLKYPPLPIWKDDGPPQRVIATTVGLAYFVIDVILDIMILTLPGPMIRHLNSTRRRKLLLTAVFLMGALAVIASIVRLAYLARIQYEARYGDPFGDDFKEAGFSSAIWTLLDNPLTVIAANLPVLGLPLELRRKVRAIAKKASTVFSRKTSEPSTDAKSPHVEVEQHEMPNKTVPLGSVEGRKLNHYWQVMGNDEHEDLTTGEA